MTHKNIFLLLGSNSGDRLNQLSLAKNLIQHGAGKIVATSKIYETAPWGKRDQPHFLNQAVQLEASYSPEELLEKVQLIEKRLGRTRAEKWGERSIDIDIIYYANEIINRSTLIIPHPHISERKFVLVPLTEIKPGFVHPRIHKTNAQLLTECTDKLDVTEFTG
jgi:2-amino-4-hydroxy-6-hydroxymethyldihydropteridine diphosphokinase